MPNRGYQKIDIKNVHIEGVDRMPEYRWIFPEKPKDQMILDIGCYIGFYTFQAALDGAKYCIGLEKNLSIYQKALHIQRQLNFPNVEFRKTDAEKAEFSEKYFDIVLCLNVLHHIQTEKRIRNFLKKIDIWASRKMFFTLVNPVSDHNIKLTPRKKGHPIMRIKPEYLKGLWPEYKMRYIDSNVWNKTPEGRTIVEIEK